MAVSAERRFVFQRQHDNLMTIPRTAHNPYTVTFAEAKLRPCQTFRTVSPWSLVHFHYVSLGAICGVVLAVEGWSGGWELPCDHRMS